MTTKTTLDTLTAGCRLCDYLGPTWPADADRVDVSMAIAGHVRDKHGDADLEDLILALSPRFIVGTVTSMTGEDVRNVITRVNAKRADATTA
ncbi:hypothetical protein [Kitasatospora sp. NBC_01300]|uniref:hypothetical protein n=1 Tax=Kitasatospora sp. NBC_01300 TaxID=2903574 RepID=UPI002F90B3FF|nr:hypothetical protein OG556_40510 [Kitasatospora sp. NBC_01300]